MRNQLPESRLTGLVLWPPMQFWRCEPCPWCEWTLLSERIWKMLHLMGKIHDICYDNIETWIKPEDPRALCSISLIFCCPSQSPTQRCPLQVSGFMLWRNKNELSKFQNLVLKRDGLRAYDQPLIIKYNISFKWYIRVYTFELHHLLWR